MKKRGQSEVITTVLIILLVLAAVFIVYTAVRSMVSGSTQKAENRAKCIGLEMDINSAVDSTNEVSITRRPGGDSGEVTPVILVDGAVISNATCSPVTIGELVSTTCKFAIAAGQNVTVGAKIGTGTDAVTCDVISSPKTVVA